MIFKAVLRIIHIFFLLPLTVWAQPAQEGNRYGKEETQSLRLFIIGNSFSRNATAYLPQLAEEGGYELSVGRAELGGCSLQRHWESVEAEAADPSDPKGKPYGGKSLKMLLSEGKWDVVTLQQYSRLSGDVKTYEPYASNLYNFIKTLQPQAKVVLHQTWAYRSDAAKFGKINGEQLAKNQQEMWERSHASYRAVASELGIEVIPSGDAFHRVNSGKKWSYRKDTDFNYENPIKPSLPDQTHSLHSGYSWNKEGKFRLDANHANAAGCYLGSLVWYAFLFDESPVKTNFIPDDVPADFAKYLKKAALSAVKKGAKKDRKARHNLTSNNSRPN